MAMKEEHFTVKSSKFHDMVFFHSIAGKVLHSVQTMVTFPLPATILNPDGYRAIPEKEELMFTS